MGTVLVKQTRHHTILSMNKSVFKLKLKNWLLANGFRLIKMMFKLTTIDSTHLSDELWIIITEFSVPNSSFQILMAFSNSASIIKRLNIPVLSWNLNCLFDHFDTINTRDSSRLPTPITSLHSQ